MSRMQPSTARPGPGGEDRWGGYQSPLAGRYASPMMRAIWSPRRKFESWRAIWVAVARAQRELGLPIPEKAVVELAAKLRLEDLDFARAAEHEKRLKHDVMAHVHAFGDACPTARGVIHLGMTSQDVVCNADAMVIREAMVLTIAKAARLVDAFATFAEKWKATPTLGFTHYQPAQPTTIGRRAAQWGYDTALVVERLERTLGTLRFRGLKGATGTQASFLELFGGDAAKVAELEKRVVSSLAGTTAGVHTITGPT